MKALYAGCDLHGNNNLIGIIDGEGKRVFKKKLSNDLAIGSRHTEAVSGRSSWGLRWNRRITGTGWWMG